MKLILASIVLLSSVQYAHADMTIEYNDVLNKELIIYSIKAKQLKFTQSGQNRINLFNQQKQEFISLDPESGQMSMINEAVLEQRVSQLNQQRLKKLALVERDLSEKLKTMTDDEQKVGESLVNLLKYPEMYGEQTHLILKKTKTSKQVNNINCQVYRLYRVNQRIKDVCIADKKALKISTPDYLTLRNFLDFNYTMQTRIMIAMGNTRFSLIDYKKQNLSGIAIESIEYKDDKIFQHQILNSINTETLSSDDFTLPVSVAKQ